MESQIQFWIRQTVGFANAVQSLRPNRNLGQVSGAALEEWYERSPSCPDRARRSLAIGIPTHDGEQPRIPTANRDDRPPPSLFHQGPKALLTEHLASDVNGLLRLKLIHSPSIASRVSPGASTSPLQAPTNARRTAAALSFRRVSQRFHVEEYFLMKSVPPESANISPRAWVAIIRMETSSTRSSSSNCGTTLWSREGQKRLRLFIRSCAF